MNNITITEVAEKLKASKSVTILCHNNPDEDTLGSAYALSLALKSFNIKTNLLCAKFPSDRAGKYIDISLFKTEPVLDISLIISVDVASRSMLGSLSEYYGDKVDIRLDHHSISEEFAKYNLNRPDDAACAMIVYDVIKSLVPITPDIASALYTALSSDSGGFRYENTTSSVHIMAAELIDKGADAAGISEVLYQIKTPESMRAIRIGLDNMRYICSGKVSLTVITNEDKLREGITDENLDEVSVISIQTKGLVLGIVLKQCDGEKRKFRVSMRSRNPVDCSLICKRLGGGGHDRAAGATIFADDAKEAEAVLLGAVRPYISGLGL